MKRLSLIATTLAASTAIASAADLYSPPPIEPGVAYAPASFNWTGIYAGLHGGFGGDRFEYPIFLEDGLLGPFPDGDATGQLDATSSGFFAGGQIGANWQFAPQWVAGVEADAAWSDMKGELGLSIDECCGIIPSAGLETGSKVNWFATMRGRLGFLPTERLMVYGTGGLAVGETEAYLNGHIDGFGGGISTKFTNWGWTAGAGLEYAVTNNVTLKTEYLYVDLGTEELFGDPGGPSGLDVDTKFHSIKAGVNFLYGNEGGSGADFSYSGTSSNPFNWTGLYAGVNGGYGGDKFEHPLDLSEEAVGFIADFLDQVLDIPQEFYPEEFGADADITSSGFFAGGQIGANWQFAPQWVAGVEADAAWSDIKGEVGISSDPCCGGYPGADLELGSKVNWFSTMRGRLGFLPTERLLLYGTGGLAVGETESYANLSFGGDGGGISKSETNWGWSAGGGFEYAITDNVTFKTEYLYVDLGSMELINIEDGALTLDTDTHFHTIKAGLNVHWN